MTQTTQQSSSQSTTTIDDQNKELNEYLKKLIQLVPYLKNIQNEKSLLQQKLENFQYLSISNETKATESTNGNELSDLQILQSALDYILDFLSW